MWGFATATASVNRLLRVSTMGTALQNTYCDVFSRSFASNQSLDGGSHFRLQNRQGSTIGFVVVNGGGCGLSAQSAAVKLGTS